MTPVQARQLLSTLQAAWPQQSFWGVSTVELYRRRLEAFDYEAAVRAVERLVGESVWPPKMAELTGAVRAQERALACDLRGAPLVDFAEFQAHSRPWVLLAHEVLAGRREPPPGEQLEFNL